MTFTGDHVIAMATTSENASAGANPGSTSPARCASAMAPSFPSSRPSNPARGLAAEAARVLGGRIDVLVNNAGIFPPENTAQTDEAALDRILGTNVKAPFLLTAAIAPGMAERGSGAVVNVSSWLARLGIPLSTAYCATKGAIETLTRDWAAEFGPSGVRVNAVAPGLIRDPDAGEGADESTEAVMAGTPAGGSGRPEDIAHAAVYLASDEARFVHGAVFHVDGGRGSVQFVGAP